MGEIYHTRLQRSWIFVEEMWERWEEQEVVDDSKKIASSRHNMAGVYVNSQTMTCPGLSQTKFLHKNGSKSIVPPLAKKLFAIDNCWKRENEFSLME